MLDRMMEIFAEVMHMVGAEDWWELFDSEDFALVENAIACEFGEEALEDEIFLDWVGEMAADL